MKVIIQSKQAEIACYQCDVCGKEGFSNLKWDFGYGSSRDMDLLECDFCETCGEEVLNLLQSKIPGLRIVSRI